MFLIPGGFVPRDPTPDGPFYQHSYEPSDGGQKKPPQKSKPADVTIRTVVPDAVTPDPLLGNGGSG